MFLVFLALLPAVFLVVKVYQADEIEKEPKSLLLKLLILGAISTIPAIIMEEALSALFGMLLGKDSLAYIFIEAFLIVAVSEEFCKLMAAKTASWNHPAFDYRFDAIVYCVCSALGFAALENVLYVLEGGIGVAVARAVLSVPSHAIDGVIMGYFYGHAKKASMMGNETMSKTFLVLSVIIPAIEHGIYDCSLALDSTWIMVFFVVFVVAVDGWAITFVRKQSENDTRL